MDQKPSARSTKHFKKRKAKIKTNKILDRLTFNPQKHKQKKTKNPNLRTAQRTTALYQDVGPWVMSIKVELQTGTPSVCAAFKFCSYGSKHN